MVPTQVQQISIVIAATLLAWGVEISAHAAPKKLTIYSGREEKIMAPLIEKAEKDLEMDIEVRYGDSTELAIALIEEGKNSPADVFYAQDAGSLGAVAKEGRTLSLPAQILNKVDKQFRSPVGEWVGVSGRARVIDYNTNLVNKNELPTSVMQLTNPKWRGKVGWSPTNGSFQSFVTAMRLMQGDQKTLEWLKGMKANGAKAYSGNSAIVEALGRGEIALGLVNNYYLYRFTKTDPKFPVAIHHTRGDAGALINVAGVAVLNTTDQKSDAEKFVAYMLSPEVQKYLTQEFYEYPLMKSIPVSNNQIPLKELQPPQIDLSKLSDLKGTLSLLQEAGVL
ncbi:extracellular solute-binding protein [Scytonema sp. UIC 10036]|uniref:iron ABC transporter substrate-binding protein n=1 Tax=Scytonema sp. UIC 10036 TaxID=2304196 RepID=UPI0012DAAD16|nr:iron ABC transporter substrate-binding protein [Scytonema sp. UIC 10036]MUG99161.1 extracellular solute-binding protein [Scytonema sp. UIC 10036]